MSLGYQSVDAPGLEPTFIRVLKWLLFISDGTHCNVRSIKDTYLTDHKMDKLENRLESAGFIRIHRSYLVNRHHIHKLIPRFK